MTDALGHNAIFERNTRSASTQLMNVEAVSGFVLDVETFAVAVRSEKDVILDTGVDGLPECLFEVDMSGAIHQLHSAGIFKPVLRGLHRKGLNTALPVL